MLNSALCNFQESVWNFLQVKKKEKNNLICLSGINNSSKGIHWFLKEQYLKELDDLFSLLGLSGRLNQLKNLPAMQETQRRGFNPYVRKIPWRRKRQPTPVFLPGESHGQRSMVGYSPWGRRVGQEWHNWACTHAFSILA